MLLIDDDEDFRLLFASALEESGLDVGLFGVTDGFAAINYLLGNEPYADRANFPLPDLVFLDLAMPGKGGFDVLNDIRNKLGQQQLPIIVLSDSAIKTDVAAAYSSQASAFHRKPSRYRDLVSLLRTVIPLWPDIGIPEIPNQTHQLNDARADRHRLH